MAIIDFVEFGKNTSDGWDSQTFRWGMRWNRQEFRAINGYVQTKAQLGERWEAQVNWPSPLPRNLIPAIEALIDQATMPENSLRMWPLHRPRPLGVGGGAPVVNGANQTGNTLNISGAPINTVGWLKRGDYVNVGSVGANGQLLKLTADANTNGAGQVTLSFIGTLRASPANAAAIVTVKPTALFIPAQAITSAVHGPVVSEGIVLDLIEVFA